MDILNFEHEDRKQPSMLRNPNDEIIFRRLGKEIIHAGSASLYYFEAAEDELNILQKKKELIEERELKGELNPKDTEWLETTDFEAVNSRYLKYYREEIQNKNILNNLKSFIEIYIRGDSGFYSDLESDATGSTFSASSRSSSSSSLSIKGSPTVPTFIVDSPAELELDLLHLTLTSKLFFIVTELFQSLSFELKCQLLASCIIGLIFHSILNIVISKLGDYLLIRFPIEEKFPRLAKLIKKRALYKKLIMKISLLWLILTSLFSIYAYVSLYLL